MVVTQELNDILKRGCKENFSSEREFREKIVSRLLESLGWTAPGDINYEVSIPAGTVTLKIDYVVGSGSKRFAMEIKKPDVSIDRESAPWVQLKSYMKLDDTLNYGILYNGKKMHLFKRGNGSPYLSWECGKTSPIFQYISKDIDPIAIGYTSLMLKRDSKILGGILLCDFVLIIIFGVLSSYLKSYFLMAITVVCTFILLILIILLLIYLVEYKLTKMKESQLIKDLRVVETITGK
jgi:hypothetical protein